MSMTATACRTSPSGCTGTRTARRNWACRGQGMAGEEGGGLGRRGLVGTGGDRRFGEGARDWLSDNVPRQPRPPQDAAMREFDLAWQRRQYEGGWAGVSWPAEYGGRGL